MHIVFTLHGPVNILITCFFALRSKRFILHSNMFVLGDHGDSTEQHNLISNHTHPEHL